MNWVLGDKSCDVASKKGEACIFGKVMGKTLQELKVFRGEGACCKSCGDCEKLSLLVMRDIKKDA